MCVCVCVCVCVFRQCAGVIEEGDCVYKALLPSGHVIRTVLKYVWALWEDPVDVSNYSLMPSFQFSLATSILSGYSSSVQSYV